MSRNAHTVQVSFLAIFSTSNTAQLHIPGGTSVPRARMVATIDGMSSNHWRLSMALLPGVELAALPPGAAAVVPLPIAAAPPDGPQQSRAAPSSASMAL